MRTSLLTAFNQGLFKNIALDGVYCHYIIRCICVFVYLCICILYLHVWQLKISFKTSLHQGLFKNTALDIVVPGKKVGGQKLWFRVFVHNVTIFSAKASKPVYTLKERIEACIHLQGAHQTFPNLFPKKCQLLPKSNFFSSNFSPQFNFFNLNKFCPSFSNICFNFFWKMF